MLRAHPTEGIQINERFRAIEEQLAVLSQQAGVPYSPPAAEAPPEVLELARAGDQMGAIKKYRELTGAEFDQAREVLSGL